MLALQDQELTEIAGYIKEKYGVNLASKKTLVEGRLGFYISSLGFKTFGDFFKYAQNDSTGEEITNMVNCLTTNHTYFMRESDHFEIIFSEVLPWIESLPDGRDWRIWSAGCASGEEPYGLSVYIKNYFFDRGINNSDYDTTVLASDISEKVLLAASEGVYENEKLSAMPPGWISKYFIDLGNGSHKARPELRQNVAFKKINLLDPFTVRKPYHAILCRNVMIYFDSDTRSRLIQKFFDAIIPGGYLFIGHSESLTYFSHGFKYIKPSVYRKPQE